MKTILKRVILTLLTVSMLLCIACAPANTFDDEYTQASQYTVTSDTEYNTGIDIEADTNTDAPIEDIPSEDTAQASGEDESEKITDCSPSEDIQDTSEPIEDTDTEDDVTTTPSDETTHGETTSKQNDTTEKPKDTTKPIETTSKPADTTKPIETTSKPADTTKPIETTSKPADTTKPIETTSKPADTTIPIETTSKPADTTKPIETTSPVTDAETTPPKSPYDYPFDVEAIQNDLAALGATIGLQHITVYNDGVVVTPDNSSWTDVQGANARLSGEWLKNRLYEIVLTFNDFHMSSGGSQPLKYFTVYFEQIGDEYNIYFLY